MEYEMRNGFIRAAALLPRVKVADPGYNKERICELIRRRRNRA